MVDFEQGKAQIREVVSEELAPLRRDIFKIKEALGVQAQEPRFQQARSMSDSANKKLSDGLNNLKISDSNANSIKQLVSMFPGEQSNGMTPELLTDTIVSAMSKMEDHQEERLTKTLNNWQNQMSQHQAFAGYPPPYAAAIPYVPPPQYMTPPMFPTPVTPKY